MFTSIDKALVAGIVAVMSLLNVWLGIPFWGEHTADVVETVLMVVLPMIVWLVPNRA